MKKLIIALFVFLMSVATAHAGVVTPVNCEDLFDHSIFTPQTEWDEPADICFHGVGFPDGELGVILKDKGSDVTVDFEPVTVSGGSFSSISGEVHQLFSSVPAGVYRLMAGDMEYAEDVVVHEEEGGETPVYPPEEQENPTEVPEFSTITSLLVLAGAGWYINRKKRGLLQ